MIQISIITGFLGSGKTTLLRHLLSSPAMGRTAVIMNELGDVGIDHELIEMSNESFMELTTGCLCCRVRSDLVETLIELTKRRQAGEVSFDRVVIETTGLAEPAPILQALMTDYELGEAYVLGNVITTADATNVFSTMGNYQECLRQLVVADRIVITKSDLLDDASVSKVRAGLEALNPTAECLVTVQGRIEPHEIFAADPLGLVRELPMDNVRLEQLRGFHELHANAQEIDTFAMTRDQSIHAVTLSLFLEALAENCGSQLLRVKGIVNVTEAPERPAVVQGVQHVFSPLEWLERWPSDDRSSRLVFIVRDVTKAWAATLLEIIQAEVDEESKLRERLAS